MTSPGAPEVWAGAEATSVRVRGQLRDQLAATGHDRRVPDLDRLAALGVTAVRQPVLWGWRARPGEETHWRWADRRLGRLRRLGIEPVVGLLHHGAGPDGSLLDPDFPTAFAAYARQVAQRFPWVERWIPINEPTTTARFTGLYGWWEPHENSPRAFAAILINQCRAIRAAIRSIREVVPGARLIVNEDIGRTFSTPALRDQAEFDSERRWVGLDLLAGRLAPGDLLWEYLVEAVGEASVRELVDDPEPPDLIGLDYYVTSDRFLDERIDRYPAWTWGGNGQVAYADVEMVRVDGAEVADWSGRIDEAAARYGRPLALTEVSMAGEAHDRTAWFLEAWDAACRARARGIDLVAVTAWAAFGAMGWDRMLAEPSGTYEPGIFDVRRGRVVPTPLAETVRAAAHAARAVPVVAPEPIVASAAASRASGWWRTSARVLYPVG